MPLKQSPSSMRKDELISLIEGVFTLLDRHERALYALMTDWQDSIPSQVQHQMDMMPGDVPALMRLRFQIQMVDLAGDVLTHTRLRMHEMYDPLLQKMIELKLRP